MKLFKLGKAFRTVPSMQEVPHVLAVTTIISISSLPPAFRRSACWAVSEKCAIFEFSVWHPKITRRKITSLFPSTNHLSAMKFIDTETQSFCVIL